MIQPYNSNNRQLAEERLRNFSQSRFQKRNTRNLTYYTANPKGDTQGSDYGLSDIQDAQYLQHSLESLDNNNPTKDKKEGGFIDWTKNAISDTVDLFTEDIPNSLRLFTHKLAEQNINSDISKIDELKSENEDLDLVEEYYNLVNFVNQFNRNDINKVSEEQLNQYWDAILRINQLDDYFKGDGKTKNAIAELMYNHKNLTAKNVLDVNVLYASDPNNPNNPGLFTDSSIIGAANSLVRGADWLATTVAQGLSKLGIGPNMNGYKTKHVVKNLDEYNLADKEDLLDNIYVGSQKNSKFISSQIDIDKVKQWKKYNEDRIKEKTEELKIDRDFAYEGRYKFYVPFTDVSLGQAKIYDPEDISSSFIQKQRENSTKWYSAFLHPWYTLPEVASTVGLFKHQVGAMVGDAALNGILNMVSKFNPYIAAASTGIQLVGSSALQTGASIASREDETGLEKLSGMQERIISEFHKNNVNVDNVFKQIQEYANNTLGINTDGMTDDMLLGLSLAYDIPVQVPGYRESVGIAKRGINALINQNNALMIHDILEGLPFMTYGGKAFSRALENAGSKIVFKNPSIRNAVEKQLAESSKYATKGMIDKMTTKFLLKDYPKLSLWSNHIANYAKDKFKLMAFEGLMESGEEGAQELIKNRYMRGEYDDYTKPYSMFDLNEISLVPGLYKDAVFDYFGINPNDPDNASKNLRDAMNIGFSSSFMFSSAMHAHTNLLNDPTNQNITNLYRQLKADNIIGDMIGSYAEKAQDHNHISIFFDSYAKNGKSGAFIIKALNTLRRNVDENNSLIKKQDLEDDIQLAENSWFVYNNKMINDQLKENGIKKNSDQHKLLVIDGTTAITTAEKTAELVRSNRDSYWKMNKEHLDIFEALLEEDLPEERRQQLKDENPEMYNLITVLREKHGMFLDQWKNQRQQEVDDVIKDFVSGDKNPLNDKDYLKWHRKKYNIKEDESVLLIPTAEDIEEYGKYKVALDHFGDLSKSESFINNPFIRAAAKEKASLKKGEPLNDWIANAFKNEDSRNELLNDAINKYINGNVTEKQYLTTYFHLFNLYNKINATKKALNSAKQRLIRLSAIRKYSGQDINTDRLEGIVESLTKMLESLQKSEDKVLNGKSKKENSEKMTLDDYFRDLDIKFDNQDEYESLIEQLLINSAILPSMRDVASLYTYGTSYDISKLQTAIYGKNAEESPISSDVEEYSRIKADLIKGVDLDSDVTDLDDDSKRKELHKISKKAAWKIIKNCINEAEKRMLIARRNFAEDTGIPEELLEEQLNNEDTPLDSTEQTNVDSNNKSTTKSTARRNFENEVLNGEDPNEKQQKRLEENKKKREERLKQEREEQSNPSTEDVIKEPEAQFENLGLETTEDDEEQSDTSIHPSTNTQEEPETTPIGGGEEEVQTPIVLDLGTTKENTQEKPEENKDSGTTYEPDDDDDYGDSDVEELTDTSISDMLNLEIAEDDPNSANDRASEDIAEDDPEFVNNLASEELASVTDVDSLEYNEELDIWEYKGEEMDQPSSDAITEELLLLSLLETGLSQEDLPDGSKMSKITRKILATAESIGDFIGHTFFYQPESTETIHLRVNGKDIEFDKPIAPGKQLSEKLIQKGWLLSTKKYYVVSQPEESLTAFGDIRDTLIVALILEDDSNTYIVTLRQLGATLGRVSNKINKNISKEEQEYLNIWMQRNKNGVFKDAESDIRAWLEMRNVDKSKIIPEGTTISEKGLQKLFREVVAKKAKELAKHWFVSLNAEYSETRNDTLFEKWWNGGSRPSNMSTEQLNGKMLDDDYVRHLFLERARQTFAMPGKKMLTLDQIQYQIDELRSLRNKIIDAYTTKKEENGKTVIVVPDTVIKTVTPVEVSQSNGRFDTMKDGVNPIYRNIFEEDASIDQIQEAIDSGELIFGYGTGVFGKTQYEIKGVLPNDSTTKFEGRGLSGKIYMFVKSIAENAKKVPIMLAEELFDSQQTKDGYTVYRNDILLCLQYDANTKTYTNNNENRLPSAAEVLLYLLCDRVDLGIQDYDKRREFVEFFIHNGPETIIRNTTKQRKHNIKQFEGKQLYFDRENRTLTIAMPDGRQDIGTTSIPKYKVTTFTIDDLFGDNSEDVRLSVVKAIASQMHWNTDIAHMNNTIDKGTVADVIRFFVHKDIQEGKIDNDNAYTHTVSILGCPLLSFTMSDFYDKTPTGLKQKKKISNLAWMVKNNKIKTDVSKKLFYAPFVFAKGVQTQNGKQESIETQGVPMNKEDEKQDLMFSLLELDKVELLQKELESFGIEDKITYPSGSNTVEKVLEQLNNSTVAKKNGGVVDKIIIMPPSEQQDPEEAVNYLKNQIELLLRSYEKKYPNTKINKNSFTINDATKNKIQRIYGQQNGCATLTIYGNGNININVIDYEHTTTQYVTGVFSKNKLEEDFDEEEAREWLSKTLGIDLANVIVTNAVMKSMTDDVVYGLVSLCSDYLVGGLTGYIQLSNKGGMGVTYHEAFHYVNLLMHNKKEREAVYKSFLKTHKQLSKKGTTIKEVEEALADEFAKYVEAINDKSLTGKVKRLYNNILDFLSVTRKKSEYRNVFRAIQKGQYRGAKLDKDSITEFHDKYKNGVAKSPTIPGIPNKVSKQLELDTYQQYYEVFESITTKLKQDVNASSMSDLLQYTNKKFNIVMEMLQEMLDNLNIEDERQINVLENLINNKYLVKKILKESFLDLGFKIKVKRVKDLQQETVEEGLNEDPTIKEDNPDNTWDKLDLTSSKKQNAALETKLFFSMIPDYTPVINKNGETEYIETLDNYGVQKMWSFDEAWNILLGELFSATSFEGRDADGKYLKSSVMGKVETLKNTSRFWYAVHRKLTMLQNRKNNTLLKSQIFSTLCSSKNQVQYIELKNRIEFTDDFDDYYDFDDYSDDEDFSNTYESETTVQDRTRIWSMIGDNALIISRSVPRRWSGNLASKGFISYDSTSGRSVVNRQFTDALQSKYKELLNLLKDSATSKKDFSYKEAIFGKDGIRNKMINLLQFIGIPVDNETLNTFISIYSNIKEDRPITAKEQFELFQEMFKRDQQGDFSSVITAMINSAGKEILARQGRSIKDRTLDLVFNDYKKTSQIAILAVAYNQNHPNLLDYSVKGPNGENYYPINQNNTISGIVRDLNNPDSGHTESIRKSPYCEASVILDAAEKVNINDDESMLSLNTFVGMKDANRARGADYFEITALDDYLAKMYMTERDNIVFPTMADKKTWYSLSSKNINLIHDVILDSIPQSIIYDSVYEHYETINPQKESGHGENVWKQKAREWYNDLNTNKDSSENDSTLTNILSRAEEIYNSMDTTGIGINRFSSRTLNIFANYAIAELDSLIQYYDRRHIKHILSNNNKMIENYHGKIKEITIDGVKEKRLDFGGNGGKFRYFYDLFTYNFGGKTINLNQKLEALYNLQRKLENGKVLNRNSTDQNVPYVQIGSILEKDSKGNILPFDGFEMIRTELASLRSQFVDMYGNASSELLNSVNEKLIEMVRDEMDKVTNSNSPFKLGIKNPDGSYTPTSVPSLFFDKYLKQLKEKELTTSDSDIYEIGSSGIRNQAFFCLIANNTLNTMLSCIEIEKIFTGDPAFYKWKQNPNDKYVTFEMQHFIVEEDGSSQSIVEEVLVENLDDTYSDKIKRLGGTLSPGAELRLDFSKKELSVPGNEELFSTLYTVLNIEDIKIPSPFLNEIETMFMKQLLVDYIRSNNPEEVLDFIEKTKSEGHEIINMEHAIDLIYNNDKFYKNVLDLLPKTVLDNMEDMLNKQASPYRNITVADAQVFIRPSLYRKIKKGLGEWSDVPVDDTGYCDEIAYNIIENSTYKGRKLKEGEWLTNPELYKIVKRFLTNALKMSYFQNAAELIFKDSFVVKPIYNKMAIFPIFKYHRSTSVGRMLYDRMNDKEKGEIDMMAFKSAVKVGAVQKGPSLVEKVEIKRNEKGSVSNIYQIDDAIGKISQVIKLNSQYSIDYTTEDVKEIERSENTLPISIQDLKNLRLQLNTHAHETSDRSMGTQMAKLAFSNIIDDALYGTNKPNRNPRLGSKIKKEIIRKINMLSDLGEKNIRERFYKTVNGVLVLDQNAVLKYMKSIAQSNGLGVAAEDILDNGGVIASLLQRSVFEQSVSALVNSEIVDIVTNGGTAIQQSIYGFAEIEKNRKKVYNDDYIRYNDGKSLKWSLKNGCMEVLLSANFFKTVVPKEYQDTYEHMREWLIEHDMINGTKKDGTKSKPTPFGVGYRIPTQGMSSMFGFVVADILPEQVGDLIVVPQEFTSQTGSDFDVDKIYIATFSYKDGVLETENDGTAGGIGNSLLNDYLDIITDIRNYANARASIDVITGVVQDELLNGLLKTGTKGYRTGLSQLTPSFLTMRKLEFGVGKTGIGPFALNVTNMALTQVTHLTMDFGANEYGLGALDEIQGEDGIRIADWLSAMVNAHVDVAKDAYVFDLNVNKATYNHVNLLLRCGKGKSTFLFIAQPYIKKYASLLNSANGIYNGHTDQEDTSDSKFLGKKKRIKNKLIKELLNKIQDLAEENSKNWNKEQEDLIKNVLYYYNRLILPKKQRENKNLSDNIPRLEQQSLNNNIIFNHELGSVFIKSERQENAIRHIDGGTAEQQMDALIFQLYALDAFDAINDYAEALSNLVHASAIDTKKFGNNIASQFNFENTMMMFRNQNPMFIINTLEFMDSLPKKEENGETVLDIKQNEISKRALDVYFDKTFLGKKFKLAHKFTYMLLNSQTFKASPVYRSLFFSVMRNIYGKNDIQTSNGSVYLGYNRVFNDDVVQAIANAIDDILRFNSFMSLGLEEYQDIILKNTDVIDFTIGGNIEGVKQNMERLLFGLVVENKETGQIETVEKSIFDRISELIQKIKQNPRNKEYRNLVDREGNIKNDLLLYITPLSPSDKFPIGRMLLTESQSVTKGTRKGRLIAAFDELLTSTDNEIRTLAKDLAFYAYFSTYDQNVRNSFFDLVPPRFRQQYDRALEHMIKKARSKKDDEIINMLDCIARTQGSSDSIEDALVIASNSIIDILSRNYWYDDNYVPRFRVPSVSSRSIGQYGTYYSAPMTAYKGSDLFPTFIITSNSESLYFKVVNKKGEVLLYKRTGTLKRNKITEQGIRKDQDSYIYTAVPKAGIHKGNLNQFELFCDYTTPSLFESNKIMKIFAEDVVRKEISKLVSSYNDIKDSKFIIDVDWSYDDVPVSYTEENIEMYSPLQEQEGVKIAGAIFRFENSANWSSNKNADIIINLNNEQTSVEESSNIWKGNESNKEGHTNKTISLGINDITMSDAVYEKIKLLSEGKLDSGISISFSTNTYDNYFEVPSEYINDAIEKVVKEKQINENITDEYVLDNERERLKNDSDFIRSVKLEYVSQIVYNILDEISSISNIKTISVSANSGKTLLALSLAKLHGKNQSDFEISNTTIKVDMSMKKTRTGRYKAKYLRKDLLDLFKESKSYIEQNTKLNEDNSEKIVQEEQPKNEDKNDDKNEDKNDLQDTTKQDTMTTTNDNLSSLASILSRFANEDDDYDDEDYSGNTDDDIIEESSNSDEHSNC